MSTIAIVSYLKIVKPKFKDSSVIVSQRGLQSQLRHNVSFGRRKPKKSFARAKIQRKPTLKGKKTKTCV